MTAAVRALLAVVVAGSAFLASAQTNPDTDRGARPGLAYRVEGLDHVNLFNGNVTLNLPIGQTYTINGTLSYGFVASYATNAWDPGIYTYESFDSDGLQTKEYTYRYPAQHTNAGLGWMVTFGKLYTDPDTNQRIYVSPDGSEHRLHGTLHGEADTANDPDRYTRDGTYIRAKASGTSTVLEFPDGTRHTFDADGRLREMNDRFGNWMKVKPDGVQTASDPRPGSPLWVITDSLGRQHKVYFRPSWSFYEYLWDDGEKPHDVIDRIVLAAFGGTTAEYTFNYDALPPQPVDPNPPNPELTTSRQCFGQHPPQVTAYVYVPVLRSIGMPEGASYVFATDRGDRLTCSRPAFGGYSGNIATLGLPTGGKVEWTYQEYAFPQATIGSKGIGLRYPHNAGIQSRRTLLDGVTVARTEYILGHVDPGDLWTDLTRQVRNYNGDATLVNATTHYFTGCRSPLDDCSGGRSPHDYGRPFSMTAGQAGSGYLTSLFQEADSAGALHTKRWNYVRYESDAGAVPVAQDSNHRVWYERTVHGEGSYSDVTHSDFDGLGHYRQSVTGGNIPKTNARTTYTGYNSGVGTYTGSLNGSTAPYTMLSSSAPWILGTYDRQWVSESVQKAGQTPATQVQETRFCFDSSGFLTSRRAFSDLGTAARDASGNPAADLLAVSARSTDAQGRLQLTERFYGDGVAPSPSPFTCGTIPTTIPAYRIEHLYEKGALARSWYVDRDGNPVSFFTVDREIDLNTGLPSVVHRFRRNAQPLTGGTSTTLVYDGLGRLTDVDGAQLDVAHRYSLDPPEITTTESDAAGSLLRSSTTIFDGLGRAVAERRTMADNSTAEHKTEYNGLGWKTKVTDWGAAASTTFQYDGSGRAVKITPPDQTDAGATVISYPTPFQTERVSKVHTGSLSDATTTEQYDGHGRLVSVTEPAAPLGGARPVTDYSYDVGNRLAQVCSNAGSTTCGQTRTFTYDGRGLLVSETHPENGTTSYVAYDARGHLLRRHHGEGISDVTFTYDAAERLTDVYEKVGTVDRRLKRFLFYKENVAADGAVNGLLQDAVRYNWLDSVRTVQVRETYKYDAEGRATNRLTSDYYCTTGCSVLYAGTKLHEFDQSFAYDPSGAVTTLNYPKCLIGTCASLPDRSVTNAYTNGYLTGVTSGSALSSTIAYHQSGMVKTVTHANGVTDTQNVDAGRMVPSRPETIVTSGFTIQAACVAPTFGAQPGSVTIQSGSSATLTAAATGETGLAVTLRWYLGTAPNESSPVHTGGSYTVTPPSTTSYWVKATNDCGSAVSRTATVTVCPRPTIGSGTVSTTITRGQQKTLSLSNVNGQGFTPVVYQWNTVSGSVETPIAGATGSSLSVSPLQTTGYRARVTNSCGGTATHNVTITVVAPPTVPTGVTATYGAFRGEVVITWNPSSSAVGYTIERSDGTELRVNATSTTFADSNVTIGVAYSYTVRARDVNGAESARSVPDIATVLAFADDPLRTPQGAGGGTMIRGVHISELRQAIDTLRTLARLSRAWTSYGPATGVVRRSHFVEMLAALDEARAEFNLPPLVLSDSLNLNQLVYGRTIEELRDGVR